eukprot:7332543-Alexandrium_andersonii.AAC.1
MPTKCSTARKLQRELIAVAPRPKGSKARTPRSPRAAARASRQALWSRQARGREGGPAPPLGATSLAFA